VIVLGIHRTGGEYLGAPGKETRIEPEDTLVLYGSEERLEELDCHRSGEQGDRAHAAAAAAR
jgi:uncharacterized protein with PhoU and TrkA domain